MEKPSITIENIDELKVIYVRFRGTYLEFRKNCAKLYKKLLDYATRNKLIIEGETKVMTIYHDNPFITDSKNLRTSIAMSLPKVCNIIDDDEISFMTISGKFAVGHFELTRTEYDKAWKYMYQEWLFVENVKPRDSFPFEMYITQPPKNFKDKSYTDIYIPIE